MQLIMNGNEFMIFLQIRVTPEDVPHETIKKAWDFCPLRGGFTEIKLLHC